MMMKIRLSVSIASHQPLGKTVSLHSKEKVQHLTTKVLSLILRFQTS